jgi:hypothetical protein
LGLGWVKEIRDLPRHARAQLGLEMGVEWRLSPELKEVWEAQGGVITLRAR